MFVHMVFFWFNDAGSEVQRAAVIQSCDELLGRIPGVRHLWAGRPAMTPRDVVDNSYDVGLCVVLDDAAGHDVYQSHALHLEFIARHKASRKRVQVYDFQ